MLALPHGELDITDTADHAIEPLAELRDRGDRRARPPRARAGRVHQPRGARARRAHRRRHRHRPGRGRARRGQPRPTSSPRTATRPTGATSRSSPSSPSASRRASPSGSCCASAARRSRSSGEGKVESIVIGRNELYKDESGAIRARDTGERRRSSAGSCCARSATRAPGWRASRSTPRRGVIPNEAGRVVDPETGEQVPGHYVVGWIKRGPSGVIGTNKKDAADTVARSSRTSRPGEVSPSCDPAHADRRASSTSAAATTSPTWAGRRSTRAEQAAGEPHGRPRVKFCRVHEMVEASRQGVGRLTMADLAELARADRGGPARRRGRGARRGRRRPPARDRRRAAVRRHHADRPAPRCPRRGQAPVRRRLDPRAVDRDHGARARAARRASLP